MNEIIKIIEIEIGGVTVKCKPDELKHLHAALGELLNIQTEKIVEKHFVPTTAYPRPHWYWNGSGFYSNGTVSKGNGTGDFGKYNISLSGSTAQLKTI